MTLKHTWRWLCASVCALLSAGCFSSGGGDAAAASLAIVKPVASCASLTQLSLIDIGGVGSTITSATEGTVAVNGTDVAFCTVEGTLAPSVSFRVRLPVDSWTQRMMHIGCDGLCGSVSASVEPIASYGCPLVQSGGFVLASTDMGHSSTDATWAQDAQKRVDFAYRGVHVTTLAAKKLVQAYYGQAHKRAYFVGCSDGGREGLMAAQRYPTDYDGIVVGAPAFLFQVQNSLHHGWMARANRDTGLTTGSLVLYPAKATLLHKAVVAACDVLDGAADGLLTDPRSCTFNPATLACAADATDTSACLTATELATVTKFYGGPRDPATDRRILVGGPQFGSELSWAGVFVPPTDAPASRVSSEMFVASARPLIFTDTTPPTLDEFEFTEAFYSKLRPRHPLNGATNPDLSAFQAAGGKLILWHGWSDPHISPIGTIAYHEAMQRTLGQSRMDGFMRMYLVPGVAHCGGGEGLDRMDLVSAIVNWVEAGTVPDAVATHRVDDSGTVTSARPVYPYPAVARHDGSGDINAAASWRRGNALHTLPVPDWAGVDLFTPYAAAPL